MAEIVKVLMDSKALCFNELLTTAPVNGKFIFSVITPVLWCTSVKCTNGECHTESSKSLVCRIHHFSFN